MELSYWQSRWKKGNIGFHLDEYYPGLTENWDEIDIKPDATVLVPLCGKSRDLLWLSRRAKKVIGVEVSQTAINQFINEHNLKTHNSSFTSFSIVTSGNIELWCGDFFKLTEEKFEAIDLIYDKAALTALPPGMRIRYSKKLKNLSSPHTKILIQHFKYNQNEMNGPPFSIPQKEISDLFSDYFVIQELQKMELEIKNFKKFQNRGLKSHLIEYLSLLSGKEIN